MGNDYPNYHYWTPVSGDSLRTFSSTSETCLLSCDHWLDLHVSGKEFMSMFISYIVYHYGLYIVHVYMYMHVLVILITL